MFTFSNKSLPRLAASLTGVLFAIAQSNAVAQQIPYVEEFTTTTFEDALATTADWDTTSPGVLKLPTASSPSPIQSLLDPFTPASVGVAVELVDNAITRAVAVGDLDGDGDLDLAFGNNGRNTVYFNNGVSAGTFTKGATIPDDYFGFGNTRSAVIADFNGDGHMDLAFAEFNGNPSTGEGQASRVHFNNGSGTMDVFTAGDFSDLGERTLKGDSLAVGDVDNDGDLDIVLGIQLGYVRVFRNDGFGEFAEEIIADPTASDAPSFHARTVLLGDLDRDGDLDIVAAREYQDTRVYLNDGDGDFTVAPVQSVAGGISNALNSPDTGALGDVNGDGLLDLLIGNDGSGLLAPAQPNRLYLNSGNPANIFPSVTMAFSDGDNTNAARFVDVDRDGDLDIVTADFDAPNVPGVSPDVPGPNRLYVNDPVANAPNIFPASGTNITGDIKVTKSVFHGDFDGDNALDLIFANSTPGSGTNDLVFSSNVASGNNADQLYATAVSEPVNGADSVPAGGLILLTNDDNIEGNTVFNYWVTDDGGLSWKSIQPGRSFSFPDPSDNILRWRAELSSPSPALRPNLDSIQIVRNQRPFFNIGSDVLPDATEDVEYLQISVIPALDPDAGDSVDIRVDPDGTLPAWLTLTDNNDGTAGLSGTPTSADLGANEVPLVVVDGAGFSSPVRTFTIEVLPTQDAPVVNNPTPDQEFAQGDTVALDVSGAFFDEDGDTLSYSDGGTLPASLSIASDTGIISGTLTNADALASPFNVSITADDGNGGSVADDFVLTVNNVNDAPTFASTPVTDAMEGSAYSYAISVEDIDGDAIAITSGALPGWLILADNGDGTASLSGTPGTADVGQVNVTLTADDATTTVDQSFTITVANLNDAPAFTSTPETAVTEGNAYSYSITAEDSDGDSITITAGALPDWLTLTDNGDGTATLSGTPSAADVGTVNVTLTADDGSTTTDQAFAIEVSAAPAPPPPPPPPPPPSSSGGGGSTGFGELLGLLLLAGAARRRLRTVRSGL